MASWMLSTTLLRKRRKALSTFGDAVPRTAARSFATSLNAG